MKEGKKGYLLVISFRYDFLSLWHSVSSRNILSVTVNFVFFTARRKGPVLGLYKLPSHQFASRLMLDPQKATCTILPMGQTWTPTGEFTVIWNQRSTEVRLSVNCIKIFRWLSWQIWNLKFSAKTLHTHMTQYDKQHVRVDVDKPETGMLLLTFVLSLS